MKWVVFAVVVILSAVILWPLIDLRLEAWNQARNLPSTRDPGLVGVWEGTRHGDRYFYQFRSDGTGSLAKNKPDHIYAWIKWGTSDGRIVFGMPTIDSGRFYIRANYELRSSGSEIRFSDFKSDRFLPVLKRAPAK